MAFNKATGKIASVNLRGDIILREGGTNTIIPGHKELIENIASIGNTVFYSSEENVYSVDATASRLRVNPTKRITLKQKIDQLAANSHSVYAGSFDKGLSKLSGDSASGFTQTATVAMSAKAVSIGLDDDTVYVLKHDGEITEFGAADLSQKRSHKITAFKPTCISFSSATKELWVGDDKGKIHMLS